VKDETFYRLVGGTVEFGERGAATLKRELKEELGAEAEVGDLIATVENLFTYEGEAAHEIVLVYECRLPDERLYQLEAWDAEETTRDGVITHPVSWRRVDSFGADGGILYPDALLDLL
jgi:ADP-ribose pyrophosphatase YjhB (NUDIX family)